MPRSRRLCTLIVALFACGGLSACGKHEATGLVRTAETEGIYLDVGDLKYQVQVSRQFNPEDVQDKAFLEGIPRAERKLKPDEVWFGVLMRVQNTTSKAILPASDIQITDTQDEVFKPLELEPSNVFAYRANVAIPAGETVPEIDSPGYDSPSRGALILFKLTLAGLNNRPLELKFESRSVPQQTGIVDLDV